MFSQHRQAGKRYLGLHRPRRPAIDRTGRTTASTVADGGWDVGRIYETRGGPDNLRWFWSLTINGPMTRADHGSRYRSGRPPDWLKFKNPEAPGGWREAEEDWGR